MPTKRRKLKPMKTQSAPRASVTFPPDLYLTLERIAKEKKVSIAWVVRDAAEKYVEDRMPLFGRPVESAKDRA